MKESIIEREYPYRHSLGFVAFLLLSGGSFAVLALWFAATDHRDIIINGIIPLRGEAAVILRWTCFAFFAVIFFIGCKMLWIRVTVSNQRIAFTPDGILLPRTRWASEEEFVEYRVIVDVRFEWFAVGRKREVIFLRFICPKGKFSIARQKLTKEAFDEICWLLQQKVRQANNFSAQS